MVALERIQDQRLVGLGNLEVGEAAAIGQVELGHHGLHGQTGQLGVHLDIHRLVGLDADDQLVARNILENARGDITELNADLGLLLVQGCDGRSVSLRSSQTWNRKKHTFTGLQDKGHAVPPLILNVRDHGAEGRAPRVLGNCVVLLVRGLAAVQRLAVLADDDVLRLDGVHGAQNTNLQRSILARVRGDIWLFGLPSRHGYPQPRRRWAAPWRAASGLARDLRNVREPISNFPASVIQKMQRLTVLHHVTNNAKLVKVTPTALGAERLFERDLFRAHVSDPPELSPTTESEKT